MLHRYEKRLQRGAGPTKNHEVLKEMSGFRTAEFGERHDTMRG